MSAIFLWRDKTFGARDKNDRSPYNAPVPNEYQEDELTRRLDRIQQLTDELAKCQRDAIEQQDLAERIHREITLARLALRRVK
jgi:hypothetical protein